MDSGTHKTAALVLEGDRRLLTRWARSLRHRGWHVDPVSRIAAVRALLTGQRNWEVVLLDLDAPDGDASCLIPELAGIRPAPAVAVVSDCLDAQRILSKCRGCALAVPKPLRLSQVVALMETLRARVVIDEWAGAFCQHHGLSTRESEVVLLATKGAQNPGIASSLDVAVGTLSTYWNRVFRKTRCQSREQVMIAAHEYRARL